MNDHDIVAVVRGKSNPMKLIPKFRQYVQAKNKKKREHWKRTRRLVNGVREGYPLLYVSAHHFVNWLCKYQAYKRVNFEKVQMRRK